MDLAFYLYEINEVFNTNFFCSFNFLNNLLKKSLVISSIKILKQGRHTSCSPATLLSRGILCR